MFSRDARRERRTSRPRRRIGAVAPERLEGRELMAYSSLGFSLPDLAVTGQTAPVTQWGGTVTIDVTLRNLGASTITEPTALPPASQVGVAPDGTVSPPYYTPSQSDAAGATIGVFLVPQGRSLARGIRIGNITPPLASQNSLQQFQSTLTLPAQPAGFPARGQYSIRLVANDNRAVQETTYRNNVSPPMLVRLTPAPANPALRAISFDLPERGLTPGDVIAPRLQIANIGATSLTSDVEVAVVASTSPDFNAGSSIVALYTIAGGLDGVNSTPLPNASRHVRSTRDLRNQIITPRNNVATIDGALATLPVSPRTYYLGVVVDPYNKPNLPNQPANRLELIKLVSVAGRDTATGVVGGGTTEPFQYPPDGVPIGVTY